MKLEMLFYALSIVFFFVACAFGTLWSRSNDLVADLERQRADWQTERIFLSSQLSAVTYVREHTPPVIETVYQPNTFREFAMVEALRTWLAQNKLSMVDFAFPDFGPGADCDDLAIELQRRALSAGYLMSVQAVDEDGKIGGVQVKLPGVFHAGLTTYIGNDIYYIESVPPHEVVLIGHRD